MMGHARFPCTIWNIPLLPQVLHSVSYSEELLLLLSWMRLDRLGSDSGDCCVLDGGDMLILRFLLRLALVSGGDGVGLRFHSRHCGLGDCWSSVRSVMP